MLHSAPTGHRSTTLPASLLLHGLAGKDVDLLVRAAVDDLQLGRAADLAREPHAAGAHDAAVGEQRDLVADVVLVRLDVLRLLQPAVAAAVVEAVVLQEALARLVAGRAIERMIEQQVFERRLLGRLHLLAVGDDTVPSFTGVWQPGTSFGCITIVPSGFFSPTSTRHIRQLATTDSAGCQQ